MILAIISFIGGGLIGYLYARAEKWYINNEIRQLLFDCRAELSRQRHAKAENEANFLDKIMNAEGK